MINSGGSGTVPAGLPQGETEGFYHVFLDDIDIVTHFHKKNYVVTVYERSENDR